MNFKKLFAYVLLALSFVSYAEYVEVVKVEGVNLVSQESLASIIDLSVGQDVDSDAIQAQISRLYRSGYFQQVEITLENHVLTIQLTEQPIIEKIKVDSKVIDDETIKKQLEQASIVTGEILNEIMLESWRIQLRHSLRQSGYHEANIAVDVLQKDKHTAELSIMVSEGSGTKLRSVVFEGDKKFQDRVLNSVLSSRATSFLSFITSDDLFSQQQLEMDRVNLVKFYQSKGYRTPDIRLNISDVTPTQRIWSSHYKKATFTIDAGEKYTIDSTKFVEDGANWPQELVDQLESALAGKVYNASIMPLVNKIIHEYYAKEEYGSFYHAIVEDKIVSRNQVSLNVKLVTDVSFVRFIHIVGNSSTQDEPLRRAISVQESKPFDSNMIRFSEYSLRNLRYIQNAQIHAVKVSDNVYDLHVVVQEVPSSFSLEGSADKSGSSPFSAKGSITESNLLGTGNSLEASVQLSFKQQQASLQLFQPHVNLSGHSLTTALSFNRQSKDNPETLSYHSDAFSLLSSYAVPISNHFSANFGAGVVYNHYYEIDKASKIVRQYFEKHDREAVDQYKLSFGTTYSQIDSAYMPTEGITSGLTGVVTLPFGEGITYYNLAANIQGYYPLGEAYDQPIVLRARLIGKYANDYKDESADIPFFARYYAGGLGTVRGYDNSSLGPTYNEEIRERNSECEYTGAILNIIKKAKGGNKLVVATAEIQLPSPMPEIMTPYLFVDAGNVFDEAEKIDLTSLRASAGASMEFSLPMGKFTLSLATPINNSPDDRFSTFTFGFGTMF